jgi:hypothetical protein
LSIRLRHDFDEPSVPVVKKFIFIFISNNPIQTTIHGSESIVDARKELEQFFPYQQTLAIIKPGLTPNQKGNSSK